MSEQQRYAVLVGNGTFEPAAKLFPLACPRNDVEGLAGVLTDPHLGGFKVWQLIDEPRQQIERTVNEVFNKAEFEDLVLFYYSGHGVLNRRGLLHLATADTDRDVLESTCLSIHTLRHFKEVSYAQQVIFILDCCYSGQGGDDWVKKGQAKEQVDFILQGVGTYILSASTAIQTANEKQEQNYSVFTGPLIEGIRSGDADNRPYADGNIDIDELFEYVCAEVRKVKAPQEPRRWSFEAYGKLVISRSPKPLWVSVTELTDFIFDTKKHPDRNHFNAAVGVDFEGLVRTPIPLTGDMPSTSQLSLERMELAFLQGRQSLVKLQKYALPPEARQLQALSVSRMEPRAQILGECFGFLDAPSGGLQILKESWDNNGHAYWPVEANKQSMTFYLLCLYERAHVIYDGTGADYICVKVAEIAGEFRDLNIVVGGSLADFSFRDLYTVHPGAGLSGQPCARPFKPSLVTPLASPERRLQQEFGGFRCSAAQLMNNTPSFLAKKWGQAMAVWDEAIQGLGFRGIHLEKVRHDLIVPVSGRFEADGGDQPPVAE